MNSIDSQQLTLIAIIIAAALPTCVYLTQRLKQSVSTLNDEVNDLHLRIREAMYVNDIKVKKLRESGVMIEESPEKYNFPSIREDLSDPNLVIMQVADSKQDAKDHLKQLKRMLKDTEEVAKNEGILNSLAWLNLGVLIIALIALFASILAALATGGGAILIVVAAIVLLLDIIAKIIGDGLSKNNSKRAKRLKQELEDKEKKLGTA